MEQIFVGTSGKVDMPMRSMVMMKLLNRFSKESTSRTDNNYNLFMIAA